MLRNQDPLSTKPHHHHRWRFYLLFAFAVLVILLAPAALSAAGGGALTAPAAQTKASAGEILLVDVRSPQEWRQTGIPQGARQVTIHHPKGLPGFVAAMIAEVGGDLDQPIAMICARGNRSTVAQDALRRAGFTEVMNVREGMIGSPAGPGWLQRQLPIEPCRTC